MPNPLVLIVDDQADLRKLISLTLGNTDYDLIEAVDGPAALEACEQQEPDLILLDLMLPGGIDGIEICRRVRQDARLAHTKVVLLTAADQAIQRERAEEVGVDRYFPKPFSPQELRRLVESLLAANTAE
ncbi:MAG: response regulator [Gammaproteobacteria bacterium]|nr:response regulator [Gammaproteobacteria bacterium]MDH3509087.1 response regulator [Gammaproteobacteria bacterium]